ncbi:GDSL-type esterase/lipase family protein [Almyronema epifaneia]|uniref:GDSL-type esterase/lipase family protein n=1 Tax=Almyronema epifaneia S1 TaxID=2991925 RepID=A0ABW6IDC9_9CYAN
MRDFFRLLPAVPAWAVLSLSINGLLFVAVLLLSRHSSPPSDRPPVLPQANASVVDTAAETPFEPQLGERQQLNYQQWVSLLAQEADAIALQQPENLAVLLGDSISLWFPLELLPSDQTWLNQGISGETTAGLLERANLLDRTQPQVIFLMIGINDLIWGKQDAEILSNYRQLVEYLRWAHPQTQIIVQSILPHSAEQSTWQGRDRLLVLPNSRIRELNQNLAEIAADNNADYLNLYPLFADTEGRLRPDLTTDGLHLNDQGYLVWRTAIALYGQLRE